jgi:3-hydroxy-D-aspartate aldolase
MKPNRRKFVTSILATSPVYLAPTLLFAKHASYTRREIGKKMQKKGSLGDMSRSDLPTPCLLLDLDRFEANIEKMAAHSRSQSIDLRPHAKTHKCVEIAQRQIKAGARGICVATIAEAEVMSQGGIPGILITSEMVGKPKIKRLITVAKNSPDMMVAVDHPDNVKELQEAAGAARLRLNVMLDLDVGSNRTGSAPGEAALKLAQEIQKAKSLQLKGISAYAGHSSHVVGFEARKASSKEAMGKALETRDLLRKNGFELGILSGGSTGTYNIDSSIEGVSELQVGSYVFMDVDYRRIGGQSGDVYEDFAPSLTVLTTVIHRSGNKAVLDGGIKAFATDRKFGPEPRDLTGVTYSFSGDEHGKLLLENPSREVKLGDRLELIIPHCDPNVNLYDRIYGVRGEKVEAVWSVMNRAGALAYF